MVNQLCLGSMFWTTRLDADGDVFMYNGDASPRATRRMKEETRLQIRESLVHWVA